MKTVIKKFAIDMRTRLGYGTAFFLLLISYVLTLYANWELLQQAKLVDHTNKVIIHLEGLRSSLQDAETGVRGYLIMKNENYLQEYQKNKITVDSIQLWLREQTLDSISQHSRLNSLHQLIDKKFELLSFIIDYYPKHNYQLTDTLKLKTYFGYEVMERIQVTVKEMKTAEQALLAKRSEGMTMQYNALNTIIITSLVLAFLLVIYGFFTYARENKARRVADEKVFQYQEQLKERISELDQANKELIQMRGMEKFAVTGRIARTIAHEIRNPLTNINLSVDQLRTEPNDGSDGNMNIMLDMISRNSVRINQLITDLLSSTKFTELVPVKISINKVLDETLELAKDRVLLNKIEVQKDYAPGICNISVDIERIKIAFLNIIVNAIEAMEPNKGVLQLKTSSRDGKCLVSITDNGAGIDKESLAKLFEPYFTSKPKGTGLGLTNTQNIILNHNGRIHMESVAGKGSTFTVTLDCA